MSRRSQIKAMRAQGWKWPTIANRFGVTVDQVMKLARTPEPKNKLAEFKPSPDLAHVAQLDDDIRVVFARDREPTEEMKQKLESRIRRAKAQLRKKHLKEMRAQG